MEHPGPYVISEQNKPAMAPLGLCPVRLPFVVNAKEVVLGDLLGTNVLEDELEMHVAGRVSVIGGIVTDLHAIYFLLAAEQVVERNAFSTYSKEGQPKLPEIRLALGKANIKLRYRGIGNDRRPLLTLPCG